MQVDPVSYSQNEKLFHMLIGFSCIVDTIVNVLFFKTNLDAFIVNTESK